MAARGGLLPKLPGFAENALRNQFHAALSSRYGVGTTLSRDWYAHRPIAWWIPIG
jgi:hypothetical protein